MAQLPYDVETIRAEIDRVDEQIIDLLTDRFDLEALENIKRLNSSHPLPRDTEREAEVIRHYVEALGEKDGTATGRAILGVVD